MTDGYYLSTSPPLFTLGKPKKNAKESQEKPKGISVILESLQYADSHNSCIYKLLFIQRISRDISVIFPVIFPKNLRSISRRISTSYNHGMVLFSG